MAPFLAGWGWKSRIPHVVFPDVLEGQPYRHQVGMKVPAPTQFCLIPHQQGNVRGASLQPDKSRGWGKKKRVEVGVVHSAFADGGSDGAVVLFRVFGWHRAIVSKSFPSC